MLSFMASPAGPARDPLEDPREGPNPESLAPKPICDLITMESLAALEAHAPGLLEHQAAGDKHVTMLKDEKRREVWLLSKHSDHIMPKGTILGGFGSGQMSARKPERADCVPWCLVDGDKTYVQLTSSDDSDTKKAKVGTFYIVARPLEKSASQKASPLTLTSYGKVEPNGTAGKHGYTFEFPDGHPKHSPMAFVLSKAKPGQHTTKSGNYFSTLAARNGWAGSVGVMWRLTHDPVRHFLHARKPMVIAMDNISLKKGIPMKVLWIKHGEINLPKPPVDPNLQVPHMPIQS